MKIGSVGMGSGKYNMAAGTILSHCFILCTGYLAYSCKKQPCAVSALNNRSQQAIFSQRKKFGILYWEKWFGRRQPASFSIQRKTVYTV